MLESGTRKCLKLVYIKSAACQKSSQKVIEVTTLLKIFLALSLVVKVLVRLRHDMNED